MPIRVVLAEDHYIVREGIRRLLETQPDLEIAAVCDDLDSLLAAVEAERPDVVVTDIRMPPDNADEGIQAAERLRETHPDIGVVVLSQYATPSYALALLESGSAGRSYLLKERVQDVEQLVSAIQTVAEGGSVIDPKVVEALVAENARGEGSPLKQLTPRERDVLREMAAGKSNAAIGESLFLAERSVEKVIHSIFLKLGLTLGGVGPQARQGSDPLPGRERLASSRERQGADRSGLVTRSLDGQPAAESLDPIADREPFRIHVALRHDPEGECLGLVADPDRHRRAGLDALEEDEAAEVDRARDLGRIGRARRDVDPDRYVRARRRRAQRHSQTSRLQQRRIDPVREPPGLFERLLRVASRFREELLRCRGIGIDGSRRDLEVGGEADQQLLHTVVEGALEAAAFGVVRQGESLARRTKFRDLAAQRVELPIGAAWRPRRSTSSPITGSSPSSPRRRQASGTVVGRKAASPGRHRADTVEPPRATF